MDKLVIEGGHRLNGKLQIGGAKNAALPILFASALTDDECVLENVPDLSDITTTNRLLSLMGIDVHPDLKNHKVVVQAKNVTNFEAPYDLVRTMRASVLILGPLLARFGKAKVSLPGGCSIGARPVNLHLMGFEKLGTRIKIEQGYIFAEADGLKGADITFDQVSVGATENVMMAATLAKGKTVLRNCAQEPEIDDLANFLNSCGAKVTGAGTPQIAIEGVEKLYGCTHTVIADRIEAGTYLIAAAITGGEVELTHIPAYFLTALIDKLEDCGFEVRIGDDTIKLITTSKSFKAQDISTLPFPGFPTDMQAQYMALMSICDGTSVITENIFENRFMHVPEMMRLGADVTIQGNTAIVRGLHSKGTGKLTGATVMATDLRASACLVLAGLAAEGSTTVRRVYHLDRGYEKMEIKLNQLGAKILREDE